MATIIIISVLFTVYVLFTIFETEITQIMVKYDSWREDKEGENLLEQRRLDHTTAYQLAYTARMKALIMTGEWKDMCQTQKLYLEQDIWDSMAQNNND